jgi:FtsZ-binding cell division protein ZapB
METNYRTEDHNERQKQTMILTQKLYNSLFTSYNERNLKLAKETLEHINKVIDEEIEQANPKKIDCIEELKKEIQELKEENNNLNWMLKKQFDHSIEQIRKEKII